MPARSLINYWSVVYKDVALINSLINCHFCVAQRVSGKTIRVEMAPRRPGDPPVLVGAADRARAMLGWASIRSTSDVQIADAWD